MFRIGVISDTHRILRPEAAAALKGTDHIIHAGDIGSPSVIDDLRKIAPVTAVRGNVDTGEWAADCPRTAVVELSGLYIYVLHRIDELDLDPNAANFSAVIYGHSHKPDRDVRNGVLYFNPGSAGPRRFNLPVTIGYLIIRDGAVSAEIREL